MLKFFNENFKLTNDCIILATPMVLFFIFLQLYLQIFQYDLSSWQSYTTFFLTLWIAISGCFAGWFYMVKKTIQFSKKTFLFDTDRLTALSKLFLCIFKGIGKFFIPFLGLIAVLFVLKIIKTLFILYVYNSPLKPHYEILNIITSCIAFFIAYWLIYWIPEIVYSYSNPFKSLVNSIKKSYITFKQTSVYYLLIVAGCLFLHFTIQEMKIYPIVYFLELLLFYYFILYSVITVFRLYERNFIE